MKDRLPIASDIIEFFILISLAMASLFYLNGCTASALQIARDKASPENAEYWKIKRVVSAVKHENGDISVCIELNESDEAEGLELISINLTIVENLRGAAEYGEAVLRFALVCTWQRWQRSDVIRPLKGSING